MGGNGAPFAEIFGKSRRKIGKIAMKSRLGLWLTLAVSLIYLIYLGAHWLPLGYTQFELAAFVSRVWDIKRQLLQNHQLPWWTPHYMSGSSYGLNHSQGFYLVPWLAFSTFTDLPVAGKLMALAAMFASALAMYFCARHFLRNELAAWLAAMIYLFHPEQIIRAATTEHMGVIVFFPFIPMAWLFYARSLESGKFRDVFWCAVAVVGLVWTHNKQAFVQFFFFFFYFLYWALDKSRRSQWKNHIKISAEIGILSLFLGLFALLPGLIEQKHVKLFHGDPLELWQKTYSTRSFLGFIDRDGKILEKMLPAALAPIQQRGQITQDEATAVQYLFGLRAESPEKYAGIVVLLVMAAAALVNHRRENQKLFWFFVLMTLLGVNLSCGVFSVWSGNRQMLHALGVLHGLQGHTWWFWLTVLVVGAFLVAFYRKKVRGDRKKLLLCAGVLLAFVLVRGFFFISQVPFFREIRAPFVFYDLPASFFTAMLVGFFVTDVLSGKFAQKFVVGGAIAVALLALFDYWPYQKSMKKTDVPAPTIENLRATYEKIGEDPDWVKTYSISGRYFHLLGPMYGGKPQVYEAFYNWMAPLGIGLLNQRAGREFFDLVGARYLVFDKTDPQQDPRVAQSFRQVFPVAVENEDFVVFRNESARPYVTAHAHRALFAGDFRESANAALAMSAKNAALVQATKPLREFSAQELGGYERIFYAYGEWEAARRLPPDLQARAVAASAEPSVLAGNVEGEIVPLADVKLLRPSSHRVEISCHAPQKAVAVIAESYFPFWRATVNGRETDVLRAQCGLMGVEISAGANEIVLEYRQPRVYAWGGMVSLLTLVGSFVALWRAPSKNHHATSAGVSTGAARRAAGR
jgi:hypothetical protein